MFFRKFQQPSHLKKTLLEIGFLYLSGESCPLRLLKTLSLCHYLEKHNHLLVMKKSYQICSSLFWIAVLLWPLGILLGHRMGPALEGLRHLHPNIFVCCHVHLDPVFSNDRFVKLSEKLEKISSMASTFGIISVLVPVTIRIPVLVSPGI